MLDSDCAAALIRHFDSRADWTVRRTEQIRFDGEFTIERTTLIECVLPTGFVEDVGQIEGRNQSVGHASDP